MDKDRYTLNCIYGHHTIDKKIQLLNVSEEEDGKYNQILMCQTCMLESNASPKNLISLEDCCKAGDNTVILNWPPQIGQELTHQISSLTKESKKEIFRKQIQNYFDNLSAALANKIDHKKKEILINFENFQLDSQSLIILYNKIAEKKQLQTILNKNINNYDQLTKELNTFFISMRKKSNSNINEVRQWIKTYQQQENNIQFELSQSIQIITEKLIENIQFIFENKDEVKEEKAQLKLEEVNEESLVNFFTQYQSNNTEVKKLYLNNLLELEQQTLKINDSLKDLSENMQKKFNQQNSSSFNKIQEMIFEAKQAVNILKVQSYNDFAIPENNDKFDEIMKVVEQLNRLKINQLKDIESLATKIAQLTEESPQEYLENPEINENIFPISHAMKNASEMALSFTNINKEHLKQMLKKYPIFELLEIQKFIPLKLKMVPSSYSQSTSLSITNETNYVQIQNNNFAGTAYSDQILDNKKKYLVRFRFNLPFSAMSTLQIGLIRGDQLNNSVSGSSACLYYNTSCGIEEVKGKWLYGSNPLQHEQLNEIEMRVCIQDNTLVFTDYPNYKNYNFKKPREQSSYKMDENQSWRIGVYMDSSTSPQKVLTIYQFIEVESFPQIP